VNDQQQIKRLIIKILKGTPFVVLVLLISLFLAYKYISYQNPLYKSTIKIKLAKSTYGISASNLFKSFDVFSTDQDIQAEVITIQSQRIIQEALKKLDFGISYYRVGEVRTSDMYHETPFTVEVKNTPAKIFDLPIHIKIINRTSYLLYDPFQPEAEPKPYLFNSWVSLYGMKFQIKPNRENFNKPDKVLFDRYIFKINSTRQLISTIQKNLSAKEVTKHVPVILVVYKDEVPLRVKRFINTLGKTYIEDYINHKSGISKETVNFINSQLKVAGEELRKSEQALYEFKRKYKVVNTLQETETGLREISKLRVQLNNLKIESASLDTLDKYINEKGSDFLDYVPKVSFGDLLYTELVKKLKAFQAEKEKLLSIYTPDDDHVKVADQNIADIVDYIKKSIHASRLDINQAKQRLEGIYRISLTMFNKLPEREKQYTILNRQFIINQDNYSFLKKKQIEATIQSNVNMAFHRILENGEVNPKPASPNKVLIYFVTGLLDIVFGILLLYFQSYFWAKVDKRSQLEKGSTTPVAAVLKRTNRFTTKVAYSDQYADFLNELMVKQVLGTHNVVCVSSSIRQEGKTFVASQLALSYAKKGLATLLIDFNLHKPTLHQSFGPLVPVNRQTNTEFYPKSEGNRGISDFIIEDCDLEEALYRDPNSDLHIMPAGKRLQNPSEIYGHIRLKEKLDMLRNRYDAIIIDSPASIITVDAIILMKLADRSLYMMRSGFTPTLYIQYPDMLKEEYKVDNIQIVLNNIQPNTNFSGRFISSKYHYMVKEKGLKIKIKKALEYYF